MANRGTLTEAESRTFAVLGLGNPGPEYQNTRHNIGFWLLDEWVNSHRSEVGNVSWTDNKTCHYLRLKLSGLDLILIRPLRFMNRSGEASLATLNFFKVPREHTLVAHDELDLQPGVARLRFGGSSGGHRGVQDFARVSGGDGFYRLKIGIGHPRERTAGGEQAGGGKARGQAPVDVTSWVLGRPQKEEEQLIRRAVEQAAQAVDWWLLEGFQSAQQKLHSIAKLG